MVDLSKLSPPELSAAMRGGTTAWGHHGSAVEHVRYLQPVEPKSRRRCSCCNRRATHHGMANGVGLITGCEILVRRWVKDPIDVFRTRARAAKMEGV